MNRRGFIAAAGSALAFSRALGAATTTTGQSGVARRIDVHHHFLPPGYIELAREYVAKTSPAMQGVFNVQTSIAASPRSPTHWMSWARTASV